MLRLRLNPFQKKQRASRGRLLWFIKIIIVNPQSNLRLGLHQEGHPVLKPSEVNLGLLKADVNYKRSQGRISNKCC